MSVKLLTEHHLEFLSYTGSSEYTFVKIQHCWKSHITAQLVWSLIDCRSRVMSYSPGPATYFLRDYSFPTSNSSRAVVSY